MIVEEVFADIHCAHCPSATSAFSLPAIVRTYGYSPTVTQLRTVPPYAVVFVVTIALSYISDKRMVRGPFVSFYGVLAIIGCAIQLVSKNPAVRYGAIFLQICKYKHSQGWICIIYLFTDNVLQLEVMVHRQLSLAG